MNKLKNICLTLFFTTGISLKSWLDMGNFDREIELYKRLSSHLKQINFITYGGKTDKKYAKRLKPIKIFSIPWYWRCKQSILAFPLLLFNYYKELKNTDIIKTNQIPGSEIAILFKKLFRKKLIIRCGYLYSEFIKKQTNNKKIIKKAFDLEKKAFQAADIGIVTSYRQKKLVAKQYSIDPDKIKVVPNYVVTNIFKPNKKVKKKYDLIFIGRNRKQKNIYNLLNALSFLKGKKQTVSLLMISSCSQDPIVKKIVQDNNLKVIFHDNVPNFDLPKFLNQARIFILPSYFEGHPKVLLEAMSCKLPCIGTDVSGIREEVKHKETGYLCKTSAKSIARAIKLLLTDNSLRGKLGKNARQYIVKNYDIDKIVKMELDIIRRLV